MPSNPYRQDNSDDDRPDRDKNWKKPQGENRGPKRNFEDRPFAKREDRGESRPPRDGDRPYRNRPDDARGGAGDGPKRPFREREERSDKSSWRRDKPASHPFQKEDGNRERRSFPKTEDRSGPRPFSKGKDGDRERLFQKDERNKDKPFSRDGNKAGARSPFKKEEGAKAYGREANKDGAKPFQKEGFKDRYAKDGAREKPFDKEATGERRSFKKEDSEKPFRPLRKRVDKNMDTPRPGGKVGEAGDTRPFRQRQEEGKKPFGKRSEIEGDAKKDIPDYTPKSQRVEQQENANALMPLNKYLAHSGVSSRRDAAAIVKEGKVEVNGVVQTNPGYRVQEEDVVSFDGKLLTPERDYVYLLLNKPKDFITSTEDDRGRRTIMDLVATAEAGRLYPIGRLDRDTTGVILLTNDGDMAQKLSHPSYSVKKVYQATLDKDLDKKHFDAIAAGIELEDGAVVVDTIAYLENKNEIGLEIHSGRNRVVRRIFESLGYEVEKLDRVIFAGLTKKNVPRGQWRKLTEREVVLLKHFKG